MLADRSQKRIGRLFVCPTRRASLTNVDLATKSSLREASSLIEVLAQAAIAPVTLGDLVARLGLPKATAHRIAVALERHRLLRRTDSGAWTVPLGARLPLTAGSAAHVLLAWETTDPVGRDAIMERSSFTAKTLADVSRRGYAHSRAERELGVASVSAPVRDAYGEVVAAVSVSGPIARLGGRPNAQLIQAVLKAAQSLNG